MVKHQFITFTEDGIMGSGPVQILGGTGVYEGNRRARRGRR
jgi:hypothetical protein